MEDLHFGNNTENAPHYLMKSETLVDDPSLSDPSGIDIPTPGVRNDFVSSSCPEARPGTNHGIISSSLPSKLEREKPFYKALKKQPSTSKTLKGNIGFGIGLNVK